MIGIRFYSNKIVFRSSPFRRGEAAPESDDYLLGGRKSTRTGMNRIGRTGTEYLVRVCTDLVILLCRYILYKYFLSSSPVVRILFSRLAPTSCIRLHVGLHESVFVLGR